MNERWCYGVNMRFKIQDSNIIQWLRPNSLLFLWSDSLQPTLLPPYLSRKRPFCCVPHPSWPRLAVLTASFPFHSHISQVLMNGRTATKDVRMGNCLSLTCCSKEQPLLDVWSCSHLGSAGGCVAAAHHPRGCSGSLSLNPTGCSPHCWPSPFLPGGHPLCLQ